MTISNSMKMAESSSYGLENTVGKGGIALNEESSHFPTMFSKELYCRHVKSRAYMGKSYETKASKIRSINDNDKTKYTLCKLISSLIRV